MTTFLEFLRERTAASGFSTEDALASFLPLMRQCVEAHAADCVAPLDNINYLQVEGVQLWFEESQLKTPTLQSRMIQKIQQQRARAVEVVSESRAVTDVDREWRDLLIGSRDQTEIERPVYLPGYVAWEHLIDHHDPVTDVFCLGMILGSLVCGLDLSVDEELESFVRSRDNLFQLNPDLHPFVARAIVQMTELHRTRRPQDVAALFRALQNYRDQTVSFDVEMSRISGFETRDIKGKQQVVLAKLQERLFEISRRNRLLHFTPTSLSVDLTQASVPLSFDIQHIRPAQILTWTPQFQKKMTGDGTVSLNSFLNFREAIYLPSTLTRIAAEARRDEKEFGFAQLRLVACFLRWTNLKETPHESFDSPLLLIPVRLLKKKGVTDLFELQPLSDAAEVNPVIRHQFRALFGITLPERIDLNESSPEALWTFLDNQIRGTEPGVTLELVDKPRIEVLHDKARRRLEQYRRKARIGGRGVRRFLDLDYSYDPANYHPLGLKLFTARVKPVDVHLHDILSTKPRPRIAPPDQNANGAAPRQSIIDSPVALEQDRSFYSFKGRSGENPYHWEFDLCSVTLGNFRYRRMSLVRDYASLVEGKASNPAFDASFSLIPRPLSEDAHETLPLTERYHVVPCDPTQTSAIAESRSSRSYIIQGPPGTGKSQTITNLIADYVMRGKRVLFVCEKRAAIDVVYHRLKTQGLDELCCLIHDSQADKKSFVMDLKATYESFLEASSRRRNTQRKKRDELVTTIQQELRSLEQFGNSMSSFADGSTTTLIDLLGRLVQISNATPVELTAEQWERMPDYSVWEECAPILHKFDVTLRDVQPDGLLCQAPLRSLDPALSTVERPIATVSTTLSHVAAPLNSLQSVLRGRDDSFIAAWTLDHWEAVVSFAEQASLLAENGLIELLDSDSPLNAIVRKHTPKLERCAAEHTAAKQRTLAWKERLSPHETQIALAQAKRQESSFFRFLNPGWWKLKGIVEQRYDFKAHSIVVPVSQVLQWLSDEYEAEKQCRTAGNELTDELGSSLNWQTLTQRVGEVASFVESASGPVQAFAEALRVAESPNDSVKQMIGCRQSLTSLRDALYSVVLDWEKNSASELQRELAGIDDSLDELPNFLECLESLANVPPSVASVLRSEPLTVDALEAAAATKTIDAAWRHDRELARFTGSTRDRISLRLEELYDEWQTLNAECVREFVRQRFLDNVKVTQLPAAKLTAEQKSLKKIYSKGRRELEHEFGKSMRYKPIRDLVAEESGLVVRDLKPVWLMSPLSVSDTLPLDTEHVDVVIFDEASQITLEEAVPSLFRATQAIVVGDEMQLPPTNFFSSSPSEDEEQLTFEEGGEVVEYDLNSDSFLNHAAKNLSSRMLGWHYRSRSESLISFSNWAFYEGRLLTVPDESRVVAKRDELIATVAEAGVPAAAELLNRPVSFHFVEHGVYQKRRNTAEAEYIAQIVRALLNDERRMTIGIVAFSEAQQDEIDQALTSLAQDDSDFSTKLEAEYDREDDGQFVGLLVKNLENIQGDERDVIIMSVCYGPDADGKMRMNFGPINRSGGEKRLNVAFTRAKHHMALVSSIRSTAITNEYNVGANCLKNYLRYAEASSIGDQEAAALVLRHLSLNAEHETEHAEISGVAEQIANELRQRGYVVETNVGQSHFRCNLAVCRPDSPEYQLGILLDGPSYYAQRDLLERDLMKPRLLRAFGWQVAVVLTKDWIADRDAVLNNLIEQLTGLDKM
ncbi:MAG: AAA domain-containing protein [Planctomycetota bacterium]|nr:AAA domain-containing protein [Planctomycetota bacterium]